MNVANLEINIEPFPEGGSRVRMPARRPNRVREGQSAGVAVAAGVAAALSSSSPTGRPTVDAFLVGGAVGAAAFAGASSPWWLLVVAALAAAAVGGSALVIAIATLAGVVALLVGWRRRNLSVARAVSAALSLNALARADVHAPFGLTAAVAVVVGVAILVSGLRRRPQRIRRVGFTLGGLAFGVAVLATAVFLLEAVAARTSLRSGKAEAEAAIAAVERGDYSAAADHFRRASTMLDSAHQHLSRPWVVPASFVPVVAQHRAVGTELTGDGRVAMDAAADAVERVDPDTIRLDQGTLDLSLLRALATPISELDSAMDAFSASVDSLSSRWLLPTVQDELSDLSSQLVDNEDQLDNVSLAVDLAPQMLGGEGTRVYLVLFTTPAEARGLGGFMGNYAELTVEDGHVAMTDFGRSRDLEVRSQEVGVRLTGPSDFLARYGTFGYNTDGEGLVGSAPWRNVTISPDFPSVAAVAAEMYEQITGHPVDGVIALDPYVMATLIGYTGPVDVASVGTSIDSTSAAQYILFDQYRFEGANNEERIDALEEIARQTVELLLAGAMPSPTVLADDLGPLAAARRLAVWAADPAEQELLRRVGLLGEIPQLNGADGWSVAVTNGGGNKIDTFLRRTFDYDAATTNGVTSATLRATLMNTAPASGMPDVVLSNMVGLPDGTSRLYVSFYSALTLDEATLNGRAIDLAPSTEAGWNVYSGFVTISAGRQADYQLTFSGAVADPGRVVTWEQPLVIPAQNVD